MNEMVKNWKFSVKEFRFWSIFLSLNILLFLPWLLFSFPNSDVIPYHGLLKDNWFEKFKYLFIRNNYDFFRLSFDLIIIYLIYYFIRNKKFSGLLVKFAVGLLPIVLLFQVYRAFFNIIYQIPPSIFNDITILENGLNIFLDDFSISSVLIIVSIVAFIVFICWLAARSFIDLKTLRFGKYSLAVITMILIYTATFFLRYGFISNQYFGIHFISWSLINNLKDSYEFKKGLNKIKPESFHVFNKSGYNLQRKPNLFVIFVESYGKVILQDSTVAKTYKSNMLGNQRQLNRAGYHGVSALSRAPITGGGSWLSYSSFHLGFKITHQSLFFHLLKNKEFHTYNHLFKWLQQNGYYNYRLNSLYESGNFTIPWNLYSSFYAVDEWIRYKDLNYEGVLYGFGPAPPDQYSLNYTYQLIIEKAENHQPFSLFFISKNSHTPFLLPHQIKADWKEWNNEKGEHKPSRFFHKPELENYGRAINFQLDYITDFIANCKGDNLFIVIGDHQPPALDTMGLETPVHIISKDSTLLQDFKGFGFKDGLLPKVTNEKLNHEGLYSILLRSLLSNYGYANNPLPPYLPNGISQDN